ncbi:disease resistance protein RGA4-like [Triticum dicoccoides]|uniref:disease resistance protein RGA4-like n=1 Tax=Triticum dicoccoides TaxID=85692 RepID=UPI0018905FBC|nr:disease resistance protein RGA4-like [Triticum dicoccoides]
MEIAAALVGAVATAAATTAASKLTTLIGNRQCEATVKGEAQFIKDEVRFINSLIESVPKELGLSPLQTQCIVQLSRLACEIEDCVDLFHTGKTNSLADDIGRLKTKSNEMRERISAYLEIENKMVPTGTNRLVEDRRRLLGTSQGAAVIPQELRDLLDDSNHRFWVDKNFNCLLYLCLFPPNQDVSTKPLMRRWVAEGLVDGANVAAENLSFLMDKSIIRSIHTSNNGEVETCQSTSQMHACISEKSKSQNFVVVCDGAASITELAEARRLSVHPPANGIPELNFPEDLPSLRTLAVFPADEANPDRFEAALDFSRYKVLRVLDLKECAPLSEQHLKDIISNHRQLLMKYLSINLGKINEIPRSIMELNQLETLDLSGSASETVTVHKEVLLLPKLKHLLGKFQLNIMESNPLKSHSGLRDFLTDKSTLETLEGFVTGTRYGFQDLMSLMKCLRMVKIWCKSDASQSNLDILSSAIRKFIRRGTDEPHCGRSLSVDFEACLRGFMNEIDPVTGGILASLQLRGKLSQFPPFVAGLSVIEELCLCSTGLSWEVIQNGLIMVKGLKYLRLVEDNLVHFDMPPKAADHLRSIERVSVVSSRRLDITIPNEALPLLVSLQILCQDLGVSPATANIQINHMNKLKEITLHHQLASGIRTQWEEGASGHPNKPVLLFIKGP